jgi:hypothetical protein
VIFEDDRAHAAALGQFGQVDCVDAARDRVGRGMHVDIDHAIQGLRLCRRVRRSKNRKEETR